jgi:acetylornithine deacetylase
MSSLELTAELQASILDAVDQRFDQQIAFTQELVRYPSQRTQAHSA